MKKILVLLVCSSLVVIGCSSTVKIQSMPGEAKVYIDGEYKGVTPYSQRDTKPFFLPGQLKLSKEGYEDFTIDLKKDKFSTANCIGGVLVWVPFLWVLEYENEKTYELKKKK